MIVFFNKILLLISILIFILFNIKKYEKFTNYNKIEFKSQLDQDKKVLKYFNYKKNGFFIEAGANDGIKHSNTYYLEKKYNWKGICIEPVPNIFNKLIKNRNCINLQEVLYDINDKEIILDLAEQDGYSGIKNDMDHKRKTIKSFTFKTKTLTKVLNDNNAPSNIDYLSLDTEGSELKILKGLDFDKYKINYINVEHNYKEPRRKEIKKLLLSKGYKYLGENKWDDIYILPKIKIIQ
tara:strand:- start:70 stop:780 length:711 start_codon:yes stop_codon:yes gene_type:complete